MSDGTAPSGASDFERLESMFHAATALSEPARGAFLDDVLRSDPEVGRTLAELLAAHESPALPEATAVGPFCGTLGPYALRTIRGSGGSGVVYEVTRGGQTYALKLFHARSDGADRQTQEREIAALERVRHPSVAALVDHGTSDDGRLYLITEFAHGISLADWTRTLTPTRDERLAVVESMARAIEAAHQAGVIHRDLKPSNVLIARSGSAWLPKIIDFGIARIVDGDSAAARPTLGTTGRIVGTLAYMSPEQATDARTVDVRSDVHSLGAILYELLTGSLPHRLDDVPLDRAIARIRSSPPRRADDVDRSIPRPLGDVLAQALALEPRDRYPSAAGFADDLARCRAGQRVAARPLVFTERSVRFIARHPRAVAFAVLVLVGVSATTLGFLWLAGEARLARAEAIASAEAESDVRLLFVDALKQANKRWSESHVPTLREFADSAADRLAERGPSATNRLGLLLGDLYLQLGSAERAIPFLEAALADRERRLGKDAEGTIETLHSLSSATFLASDHRRARELAARVAQWSRTRLPEQASRLIHALRTQISVDVPAGALDSAGAAVAEMEGLASLPGIANSEAFELAAVDAAVVARLKGDVVGAEQRIREVIERLIERFGPDSRPVVLARIELGNGALASRKLDVAHEQFGLAYSSAVRMSGAQPGGDAEQALPPDPWCASILACRAQAANGLGRLDEARRDLERALTVVEIRFGRESASAIGIHLELARTCLTQRDFDATVEHSERALSMAEQIYDPRSSSLLEPLEMRGYAYLATSRFAEAIACFERASRLEISALTNDPRRLRMVLRKGMAENQSGDFKTGLLTLSDLSNAADGDVPGAVEIRIVAAEHAAFAASRLGGADEALRLLDGARALAERDGLGQRVAEVDALRNRIAGTVDSTKNENP